jgi:hypothetical protein
LGMSIRGNGQPDIDPRRGRRWQTSTGFLNG